MFDLKATIMYGDTPVCYFEAESNILKHKKVYNKMMLPAPLFICGVTLNIIESWLYRRRPTTNTNLHEFVTKAHARSLSDEYWIRLEEI